MSRRRWEQPYNDFDNCCNRGHHHHHGMFGLIPMIVDLIVGVVTFGLTVAFKVVGAVFQSFFGTISDMDRNRRDESRAERSNERYDRRMGYDNSTQNASGSSQQYSEAKQESTSNNNAGKQDKKAEPKAGEATKRQHPRDWNILIFALTLIPAVLTLAMGKLLYTAAIVVCGILLMIIYSSIRKVSMSIKQKRAEKAAEMEEETGEDNEVVEKLIKEAFDKVYEIRRDLPKVANPEIKNSIESLCDKAEKIIGEVRTNPECLSAVKKFFYYYLDAFGEIFRKYLRISNFSESSEEIDKVVEETEKSFKDIDDIFRELCEKMLEKDMLNLKAEINVIKNSNV